MVLVHLSMPQNNCHCGIRYLAVIICSGFKDVFYFYLNVLKLYNPQ